MRTILRAAAILGLLATALAGCEPAKAKPFEPDPEQMKLTDAAVQQATQAGILRSSVLAPDIVVGPLFYALEFKYKVGLMIAVAYQRRAAGHDPAFRIRDSLSNKVIGSYDAAGRLELK